MGRAGVSTSLLSLESAGFKWDTWTRACRGRQVEEGGALEAQGQLPC